MNRSTTTSSMKLINTRILSARAREQLDWFSRSEHGAWTAEDVIEQALHHFWMFCSADGEDED